LPAERELGDQRLRSLRRGRPPAAQLHRVLLGDYNIIGVFCGLREPGDVAWRIRVMVLVRRELHACPKAAHLGREADGVGGPAGNGQATCRGGELSVLTTAMLMSRPTFSR